VSMGAQKCQQDRDDDVARDVSSRWMHAAGSARSGTRAVRQGVNICRNEASAALDAAVRKAGWHFMWGRCSDIIARSEDQPYE
jgi:hypothetical protein